MKLTFLKKNFFSTKKGKEDVLKIGIPQYNAECRKIVMRYSKEWEATVKRMGRWIDFENDYKTLNPTFMESVWWVFKQLFEKNLVYRGFKVSILNFKFYFLFFIFIFHYFGQLLNFFLSKFRLCLIQQDVILLYQILRQIKITKMPQILLVFFFKISFSFFQKKKIKSCCFFPSY